MSTTIQRCDCCKQMKPDVGAYQDTQGRILCKECGENCPKDCYHWVKVGAIFKKVDSHERI